MHRGKVKNGSSVWVGAWHLEALPAGKAVLTQPNAPKKSLLGLRALENLQIISRQRGGVLTAQGSESQGPLNGGGRAHSLPLLPSTAPQAGEMQAKWGGGPPVTPVRGPCY